MVLESRVHARKLVEWAKDKNTIKKRKNKRKKNKK